MVKHAKEIPVTYLNKGQAYSLSVVDSNPPAPGTQPIRYRTFVRVSFEEEEQRSKPAACWQLWKEGRGSSEAHQRGGKLLAVEFVEPSQGPDDERHRQIQLEKASFDGFAVTWTASPATGASACAISVRFNFLSTDFSHSKGVKGIPVRLCAKTEVITPEYAADNGTAPNMEVSYCKVKLFRDHGAERKLSNDVAHVKKAIEKLKQQIAQAEMGGNFGKRKRSNVPGTMKGAADAARPVKVPKHKRTWSMSSQEGGEKLSVEDDLHAKLAAMQDMFSSTRPISILGLRGEERDDPDLFPVHLPGDVNDFVKFEPLSRTTTFDSRHSIDGTSAASVLSPTSSSISMNSPRAAHRQLSVVQYDSGYSASQDNSPRQSCMSRNSSDEKLLLSHPIKIQKPDGSSSQLSTGYIEAVDIDPTYRPPAERPPKPSESRPESILSFFSFH